MAITIKDIEGIAKLAKLQFTHPEMESFTIRLNQILAYMEKLKESNPKNVETLAQIIDLQNVLRDHVVEPSLPLKETLENAPARTEKILTAPKEIKKSSKRKAKGSK